MRRHVYFYTLTTRPFAACEEVLLGSPGGWLPPPSRRSGSSWHVTLHAEGALPTPVATHLADVEVGGARTGDALALPLSWRSVHADRVLPVFEGELELAPLEGEGAHLSLLGSYRPPLSVVGDIGDRVLGHRIAEACVRRFVLDVAARLEADAEPARAPA